MKAMLFKPLPASQSSQLFMNYCYEPYMAALRTVALITYQQKRETIFDFKNVLLADDLRFVFCNDYTDTISTCSNLFGILSKIGSRLSKLNGGEWSPSLKTHPLHNPTLNALVNKLWPAHIICYKHVYGNTYTHLLSCKLNCPYMPIHTNSDQFISNTLTHKKIIITELLLLIFWIIYIMYVNLLTVSNQSSLYKQQHQHTPSHAHCSTLFSDKSFCSRPDIIQDQG